MAKYKDNEDTINTDETIVDIAVETSDEVIPAISNPIELNVVKPIASRDDAHYHGQGGSYVVDENGVTRKL